MECFHGLEIPKYLLYATGGILDRYWDFDLQFYVIGMKNEKMKTV
jgi:hypothetical protein